LQYSHYESIRVTPDGQAIAPILLSTIGGEQGGRAPIVIEDKNIQAAAAPESVETMADLGKAEPGRDIFAGEPVKDIKSSNVPPVQPPEEHVREQKEISSVNVGVSLSSATSDGTSEESSGSAASTVASETAARSQADATIESSTGGDGAAAKVQVAGPLAEAELEAQKVANELYPDAEN
jgi:dolichyl-phosphate-mannose-protein mannosyltransferase